MDKKIKRYLKIAVTVVIVALFVWFLILYPLTTFRKYEKQMTEAAEKYFVIKPGELPTGERIKTLTLQDLFFGSYIKEDLYIPYTKEPCSLKDSWVKVRKENDEYKYYTYLKCGILSSTIDHKGPTITLNGDEKMTVTRGEKFTDPGVKSVVDNKDGKMSTNKVTVTNNVDTSKTGTYEVNYVAFDSLSNKTEVKRTVEVVERLKSTTEKLLDGSKNFKGNPDNNYIYFSNILFRIIDVDGDNVRIVTNIDIANVNYDGVEKWLNDVFYKHLTDASKKLIVENKYCNMKLSDSNLNATECNSYTGKKKIYIPSITDINKAELDGNNYLKPGTISWTANEKDKNEAYVVRNFFIGSTGNYMSLAEKYNFGVKPVITIKGDALIKDGDGTIDNPFRLDDYTKAKADTPVSERNAGEYVDINGYPFRIIEADSDGTTKVIANFVLSSDSAQTLTSYGDNERIYNPTKKNNIGYFINNKASEYFDTSYFVNKNISVPIYKSDPAYGKEDSVKKYKVKFSAPSTYDMFSAGGNIGESYWFKDSSKDISLANAISNISSYMYGETMTGSFGVRVVGYLKSDVIINSGKGTSDNPYKVSR